VCAIEVFIEVIKTLRPHGRLSLTQYRYFYAALQYKPIERPNVRYSYSTRLATSPVGILFLLRKNMFFFFKTREKGGPTALQGEGEGPKSPILALRNIWTTLVFCVTKKRSQRGNKGSGSGHCVVHYYLYQYGLIYS